MSILACSLSTAVYKKTKKETTSKMAWKGKKYTFYFKYTVYAVFQKKRKRNFDFDDSDVCFRIVFIVRPLVKSMNEMMKMDKYIKYLHRFLNVNEL